MISLKRNDIMKDFKKGDYKIMAMTEAQKKADKRYREKNQIITKSVSYKKDDIIEGKRLLLYLEQSGKSANSYIKELIKNDLDSKGFTIDNI